jgi:hypothetical protein
MFILMISIFLVGEVCNNEALVHLVSLCLFVLRGWVCVNELQQWVLLIMQMMWDGYWGGHASSTRKTNYTSTFESYKKLGQRFQNKYVFEKLWSSEDLSCRVS